MSDDNKIHCIIPVHFLNKAEEVLPEVSEVIAPYLKGISESIQFQNFYDELIEIIERNRGDSSLIKDRNEEDILNDFEKMCDTVVEAFDFIKNEVEYSNIQYCKNSGYEIIESKKLTNDSVAIILQKVT